MVSCERRAHRNVVATTILNAFAVMDDEHR